MKTHTLEQLRVMLRHAVTTEIGASLASTLDLRWLAEAMVYELAGSLLADRLPPEQETATETITVDYPDGWWQMFRHQHRNRWWMRHLVHRHPIRMHTETRIVTLRVDLRRYRTFPRATIALPPTFGAPVHIVEYDRVTFSARP